MSIWEFGIQNQWRWDDWLLNGAEKLWENTGIVKSHTIHKISAI